MSLTMIGCAAVLAVLGGIVVAVYAALVAGSRADDEMDAYWREREEDPPTGI